MYLADFIFLYKETSASCMQTLQANNYRYKVSVLMPVYNAAPFVKAAVESILNQSFTNFEFLIIDDCSTDGTKEILKALADQRIKLHFKNSNTGYTQSLIDGINLCNGKYIARMDADDIAEPTRLEKQVQFLEQNEAYGIVGSFLSTISQNQQSEKWQYPVQDEDIRIYLLANSPFVHPAVMIRKSVLTEHGITYDKNFEPCEDYLLWVRLLNVTKGYNIPEFLLNYRLHPAQTIDLRRAELIRKANAIRAMVIQQLTGYEATPDEMVIHYYLFNELSKTSLIEIQQRKSWKDKLIRLFEHQPEYHRFINAAFGRNLETLGEFHPKIFRLVWDDAIRSWPIKSRVLFFIKCILFHKSIAAG